MNLIHRQGAGTCTPQVTPQDCGPVTLRLVRALEGQDASQDGGQDATGQDTGQEAGQATPHEAPQDTDHVADHVSDHVPPAVGGRGRTVQATEQVAGLVERRAVRKAEGGRGKRRRPVPVLRLVILDDEDGPDA